MGNASRNRSTPPDRAACTHLERTSCANTISLCTQRALVSLAMPESLDAMPAEAVFRKDPRIERVALDNGETCYVVDDALSSPSAS